MTPTPRMPLALQVASSLTPCWRGRHRSYRVRTIPSSLSLFALNYCLPSTKTQIIPGTRCLVSGLTKAAEVNGQECTVVKYLPDKGRYQVVMDGPGGGLPGACFLSVSLLSWLFFLSFLSFFLLLCLWGLVA